MKIPMWISTIISSEVLSRVTATITASNEKHKRSSIAVQYPYSKAYRKQKNTIVTTKKKIGIYPNAEVSYSGVSTLK